MRIFVASPRIISPWRRFGLRLDWRIVQPADRSVSLGSGLDPRSLELEHEVELPAADGNFRESGFCEKRGKLIALGLGKSVKIRLDTDPDPRLCALGRDARRLLFIIDLHINIIMRILLRVTGIFCEVYGLPGLESGAWASLEKLANSGYRAG